MKAKTFAYETTYETTAIGSDDIIGSVEVRILYNCTPGTPPHGISGPPENYDPGSGPEIELVNVHEEVLTIGKEYRWFGAGKELYETISDWVEMDDDLRERMENHAIECLADEEEEAKERAAEARADMDRLC